MKDILITYGPPLFVSLVYVVYKYFPTATKSKYKINGEGVIRKVKTHQEKKLRIPLIALFLFDGLFILGASFLLKKPLFKEAAPVAMMIPKVAEKLTATSAPMVASSAPITLDIVDRIFDMLSKVLGSGATLIGILIGVKDLKESKKK